MLTHRGQVTHEWPILVQIMTDPLYGANTFTHWGRVTHICVSNLTIIGSDNGLSPDRPQTIIWTNAGILLIVHLGTNFSEILIEIRIFSFTQMSLKVSSTKWRWFCLGLNVLTEPMLNYCVLYPNDIFQWDSIEIRILSLKKCILKCSSNLFVWNTRCHWIQHRKCHGFWRSGNARSQSKDIHCIELVFPDHSGLSTNRLKRNMIVNHMSHPLFTDLVAHLRKYQMIYGVVRFQLIHCSCDDCDSICTLSYHPH